MKKKILIISTIILVIIIGLIGLFVFYKVQQKEKTVEVSKINDTEITEEKIVEETKNFMMNPAGKSILFIDD